MATTQAEAEVMARTAARFDSASESLHAMLRRLERELDGLRTQWQGAGGRSFDQVRLAWGADQAKLQRALSETATAIRSAAGHYAAVDEAAAARLAPAVKPVIALPL